MRITGLCLEGYIGIYNGLGLYKIEIDLSKAKHKICLIAGPNGTGKSTIIKALHVLPDANTCFIPNRNARKTMMVENGDVIYRIDIISTCNNGKRTNEGYISKNGVELNQNGNITSYREIAFTEFDIDANFIAMSLISSEDRGLADKTPSERKKVIATRIESLEVYNEMYKSLNKKANIFKSHLNSITSKLQNLGNRDELELRLTEIQKSEYAITSSIDENKHHLIEAQTQIKILDPTGTITEQYDQLMHDFKEEEQKLHNTEIRCNSLKIKINGGDSVESINALINKSKTEVAGLQGEKKQLTESVSEIDTQIISLKNSIHALESEELKDSTLETAQKARDAKEADLVELVKDFKANNSIFSIEGCDRLSTTTIDQMIKICQDMELVHLDQDISLDDDIAITNTIREAMSVSNEIPAAISALILNKNLLVKSVDEYNEILSQLSKKEFHLNSYIAETEKQLKDTKVPESCNSIEKGKCSLLDSYKDLKSKLDEAIAELNSTSPRIKELQDTINKQQSTLDIISGAIERLKTLSTIINYLGVCADEFDTILIGISINSVCDYIIFCEAHQIEKEIAAIAGLKDNLYELANYHASRARLVTGIEAIEKTIVKCQAIVDNIHNINKQIEAKEEEKKNHLKKIATINLQIETSEVLIDKAEKRLAICKEIEELEAYYEKINGRYKDLSKQLIKMEDTGNTIQNLLNDINKYQHVVNKAMEQLTEISNEKKRIESQILIWDNFQKEYAEYNEKYNYVNILRKYSSPTQGGIQSLYMSLYMNKTLDLSNQILSMLFNGQYRILDYIINENEFRIPFIGAGMMVDDISSGSTSQKCIMGSIISMVSNASASPIYNIALLDEVDGGLDQDNRMMFADTILKAADILHIAQLFSISHSIEASINNVDVILLSNDQNYIDQFANSNIIYMYEGGK